jgi:hypothetical protein
VTWELAGRSSRRRSAGTVASVTIGPMVPLTTVATPFAARVLAAHLGAEGIVWELRGNVDGPYPVGPVEVLVSEDQLALARELVAEQVPPDAAAGRSSAVAALQQGLGELWLLLAAVLLVAAVLLGRLLVLTW